MEVCENCGKTVEFFHTASLGLPCCPECMGLQHTMILGKRPDVRESVVANALTETEVMRKPRDG